MSSPRPKVYAVTSMYWCLLTLIWVELYDFQHEIKSKANASELSWLVFISYKVWSLPGVRRGINGLFFSCLISLLAKCFEAGAISPDTTCAYTRKILCFCLDYFSRRP